MLHFIKSDRAKIAEFSGGRVRQSDEQFVAECCLPEKPEAAIIAVAVRRAVASVGSVDPLFVRAEDRFPEELSILPVWDSMDWMALILALEDQLGSRAPEHLDRWGLQHAFSIKQLVHETYGLISRQTAP